MSGSSFGKIFKLSTFGESHGGAVGVVVDGVPANIEISESEIQVDLDRRKPGQSSVSTPRSESDEVHIMSGVFEGKTTGCPILLIIYNKNQQSSDYNEIQELFRPGHADYTFHNKFGIRDHRGSGRASGRETAARVAAGSIAKKILKANGINITAYTKRAAGIDCKKIDFNEIENNIVRACDAEAAKLIIDKIHEAKDNKNSIGGIVECVVSGMPIGIGEPVFDKLEARLSQAIMSIGATKGIEFGAGFAVADMTGKENNDEMKDGKFLSNNAGGILGGMSTGEDIIFRTAFKPTSSIALPQQTINKKGENVTCITEGRHDPSIFPRAVPVVEAMAAVTILDLIMIDKGRGRNK